ncbi:MAG: putative Rossmann fold flavoprotein [Flammeovirgaceae bacterium]|jgi:predicted Rossmann fold flavoprotein
MSHGNADVIVIGGGAAGFFAAIHAAENGAKVLILEKTTKLLSKVKVSGGGRCNVTHDCDYPSQLVKFYPRGEKTLKKAFSKFDVNDTRRWFEERGVKLKTESDGRVFPVTDNSQTIIDCLMKEVDSKGIEIRMKSEVTRVEPTAAGFKLELKKGESISADKVIVTVGGSPKSDSYQWLRDLGLKIVEPVPSLFTFNVPDSDMKDLKGLSVEEGIVSIPGTKWKDDGPILITHWGFSAPAVIKLSAWAAIDLHSKGYRFPIHINWTGQSEENVRETLQEMRKNHPTKQVGSNPQFEISKRLWERLCQKSEITETLKYADLPAKKMNRFIEVLVRCSYQVDGKTTFKEEFVTAGGVDLSEVDLSTFESKKYSGLFFAGEVLNADGVTGGYNFQHAWTSGYLAGMTAGDPT